MKAGEEGRKTYQRTTLIHRELWKRRDWGVGGIDVGSVRLWESPPKKGWGLRDWGTTLRNVGKKEKLTEIRKTVG